MQRIVQLDRGSRAISRELRNMDLGCNDKGEAGGARKKASAQPTPRRSLHHCNHKLNLHVHPPTCTATAPDPHSAWTARALVALCEWALGDRIRRRRQAASTIATGCAETHYMRKNALQEAERRAQYQPPAQPRVTKQHAPGDCSSAQASPPGTRGRLVEFGS